MVADSSRVLIADRDIEVRQQLSRALLEIDIFSDCVGTTADAVARLDSDRYGVIVIDTELPPGDIEGVIRRVAEMASGERPVVLALAAAPEKARSLDTDIVQIVLRRPILLRQLLALVSSCLRGTAVDVRPVPAMLPDQPIS